MSSIIWASPRITQSLYGAMFGTSVPHVISFVGAGGKSSAINTLAWELCRSGYRVAVTTTTRMFVPEDYALLAKNMTQAESILNKRGMVWVGYPSGTRQMEGLYGSVSHLANMADFLLIEADISRKRPLKMVDRDIEPNEPAETEAVVAVAGQDSIGRSINDAVYQPNLACEVLGVGGNHAITPEDVARLLEEGYSPQYVLLNKAENQIRRNAAHDIAVALPGARCVGLCLKDWGRAENR